MLNFERRVIDGTLDDQTPFVVAYLRVFVP